MQLTGSKDGSLRTKPLLFPDKAPIGFISAAVHVSAAVGNLQMPMDEDWEPFILSVSANLLLLKRPVSWVKEQVPY